MAPFKKDRKFSGGSHRPFDNRSSGPRFGGGDRGGFADKELFKAECASCHKECQVPFRPNGKKPVYCSDCFKKEEGGDRFEQRPRFERSDSRPQRSFGASAPAAPDSRIDGLKRQLDAMQASLDKLVSVIETSNRAAALTSEMRKYVPATKKTEAPVAAPARGANKLATKAPVKSAGKASVKKEAKKPVKKVAKLKKA
jgi:CxxC-x17-CxxC domain-containing protein